MVKIRARLRTRLDLAWPGSGSVSSHSALFGAGLARSLAQLGSVLTPVHYSLLVSKLNVMGVESGGEGRVPRSRKISGGRPLRNDDISASFS